MANPASLSGSMPAPFRAVSNCFRTSGRTWSLRARADGESRILVRVNARALQSGLELLQDVRQDLVFEGARRWRIAQCAVIDGDDLLDRRWNHGTGVAAQRRRNCGQAENGAQKKACEELLHAHNSTRQSAKRCGIVSVRCFYCTSTAGEQRFRR